MVDIPLIRYVMWLAFLFDAKNWKENLHPLYLSSVYFLWDPFYGLVPFAHFKKREKHPRTSLTFRKVVG